MLFIPLEKQLSKCMLGVTVFLFIYLFIFWWKLADGSFESSYEKCWKRYVVLINQFEIQTFCLTFALTGVYFRGALQHVGHVD